MPYAVFQLDVLPMVLGTLWIRNDERLTLLGAKTYLSSLDSMVPVSLPKVGLCSMSSDL